MIYFHFPLNFTDASLPSGKIMNTGYSLIRMWSIFMVVFLPAMSLCDDDATVLGFPWPGRPCHKTTMTPRANENRGPLIMTPKTSCHGQWTVGKAPRVRDMGFIYIYIYVYVQPTMFVNAYANCN